MVRIIVSVIVCLFAGVFGSVFTSMSVNDWYATLKKPSFNPPSWVFGPVWTLLYILMGVAGAYLWKETNKNPRAKTAIFLWGFQLILNILWSALFFGMRNPLAALIELLTMWALSAYALVLFFKVSAFAAIFYLPYQCWITFALILNAAIVILN